MRRRQGFTLVEMLVTLALVLFIMVILSEAFASGLGAFRQLKAIGDMQEKLRSVTTILRHDLQNHYLETGTSTAPPPTSLWLDSSQFGPPPQSAPVTNIIPPTLGFFRIEQLDTNGGTNYITEGTDPQGLLSLRSAWTSTGSHRLYFTVRIPQNSNGQRRENYLSANVPPSAGSTTNDKLDTLGPADYQTPGVYFSQSAEVAYYLRSLVPTLGQGGQTPGATQANPSGTATPLFALYRRQLLLMDGTPTDQATANATPPPAALIPLYQDVSCRPQLGTGTPPGPTTLFFNSLSDVASISNTNNRCLTLNPLTFSAANPNFDSTTNTPGPPNFPYPNLGGRGETTSHAQVVGDDLLLSNVVSFTVRVLPAGWTPPPGQSPYDFVDIQQLPGTTTATPPFGFVYDTGLIGTPSGPQYRISALEITIRVWDVKTQQTRQLTIIQDMGGLNAPSVP